MRHYSFRRNIVVTVFFSILAVLFLNGCGDTNNVSGPPAPAAPGPLTILTASPLPAGITAVPYDITLALSGGTPPYTWSLAPSSPTLPNGLTLNPSTGNIIGAPTATGTTPTEFKLLDSKGQSVQKVLSITVNIAPTPLTITNNSLPNGSINQLYAFSLSPNGGTTPYTWGLKSGSPTLPSGLTLTTNGVISGTPTVTSNATHTFTLTDATSLTIEKPLQLSINAIPLSITTPSPLPQGTANQNYSAQLAASGGTGAYTWGLAGGSPVLPTGLTLNTSSGLISGIPTGTSNKNYTFTVTDQTPPTPQTATKTLQLIIGAAPPTLAIDTNSLPSGTVFQPYNFTLTASGGTGTKTWDIVSGSLPAGFNPLSSSGVISGTTNSSGTTPPATFRVRDSGNPQQTATRPLSITIGLPAPPHISNTPLPAGIFNVAYNHTVSVTGGIGTLVWGVISGGLPPGLNLNSTNGDIFGTPTSTGPFPPFTLQVTDQIPQSDQQNFTITINPPTPPTINSFTLPTGTVNQPYPNTQLTATGGALPYTWTVTPALAGGTLTLNSSTGVIIGTPTQGTNGITTHTFRVTDSTLPIHQFGELTRTLTINANVTPVSITTTSLPSGTVGQSYTAPLLAASGGTSPYNWSTTAMPPGLSVAAADGAITGTPTATNTNPTTFKVLDSTIPNQQSATKSLTITITAAPLPLTIATTSLSNGKVNASYNATLQATGGTGLGTYTWTLASDSPSPIPSGLTLSAGGVLSGTPTVGPPTAEGTHSLKFTVTDTTPQSVSATLSLTIAP